MAAGTLIIIKETKWKKWFKLLVQKTVKKQTKKLKDIVTKKMEEIQRLQKIVKATKSTRRSLNINKQPAANSSATGSSGPSNNNITHNNSQAMSNFMHSNSGNYAPYFIPTSCNNYLLLPLTPVFSNEIGSDKVVGGTEEEMDWTTS